METLWYSTSHIFGIAIIHSLWQGLIIYSLIRLYLLCLPATSSRGRYQLGTTGLLCMFVWFAATLWNQVNTYRFLPRTTFAPVHINDLLPLYNPLRPLPAASRYEFDLNIYMPYLTAIYAGGFLINGLRLFYAWYSMRRLKRSGIPSTPFQQQVNQLSKYFNLKRPVKVIFSHIIDVPCVVGYLKPILLLPVTLSTSLSTEEAETILLHELAHISRNDFAWNLLQQLITLLLFFNPFVHLLGRELDEERENSCDDLVVAATGQPLLYAQALYKLESQRRSAMQPALAMAATGQKYHLLNRIQRIMKTQNHHLNLKPTLLAMLLLAAGIGLATLLQPQIAQGKVSIRNIKPVFEKLFAAAADTVPDKGRLTNRSTSPHKTNSAKATGRNRSAVTSSIDGEAQDIFDPKMKQLMADLQKQSLALSQHYSNPKFLKLQEELAANGQQMQALYNNKDISRLTDEMSKAGEEFGTKWGNSPKMQELSTKMGIAGSKIGAYYSSNEFKKLDAELRKKYNLPLDHDFNYRSDDPKYRAYQDEMKRKTPADVQQQQDAMKTMGEDMKKVYEAPEYKAAQKRLQALGDSMGKAYHNPRMKEVQAQLKRYGEQMSKWQNSPEFKRQQELLKETGDKISAYTQSPEYKKHMREWTENMRTNMNKNFDRMQLDLDRQQRDLNRIEKNLNKTEKLEQPEPAEQPEPKEPTENQ